MGEPVDARSKPQNSSGSRNAAKCWAAASNPLFAGPHADWLALLPFVVLSAFLYLVGREVLLRSKATGI